MTLTNTYTFKVGNYRIIVYEYNKCLYTATCFIAEGFSKSGNMFTTIQEAVTDSYQSELLGVR